MKDSETIQKFYPMGDSGCAVAVARTALDQANSRLAHPWLIRHAVESRNTTDRVRMENLGSIGPDGSVHMLSIAIILSELVSPVIFSRYNFSDPQAQLPATANKTARETHQKCLEIINSIDIANEKPRLPTIAGLSPTLICQELLATDHFKDNSMAKSLAIIPLLNWVEWKALLVAKGYEYTPVLTAPRHIVYAETNASRESVEVADPAFPNQTVLVATNELISCIDSEFNQVIAYQVPDDDSGILRMSTADAERINSQYAYYRSPWNPF